MAKNYVCFFVFLMLAPMLRSQVDNSSPIVDWRQHNVVKYNRNIVNPTFSFVKQEGTDLSLWGRIQWVEVENSPKTYLINYSGKITEKAGAGIGLFQRQLGLFVDSGLLVNYARGIQLSRESWLTFGLNTTVFKRGLDKNAFVTPEPDPFILENQDTFVLVFMPGINLTLGNIDIGFTSENLFDYNLTEGTSVTDFSDKMYMGHLAYSHNFEKTGSMLSEGYMRGTGYVKSVPGNDIQYGANALLDLPDHGWVQVGYNNVYGISGGVGAKIGTGFAVGFIAETGTQTSNRAFGPTYEVTATIQLGRGKKDAPISFDEGPVVTKKTNADTAKNVHEEPADEVDEKLVDKIMEEQQNEELTEKDYSNIQTMEITKLDSLNFDKDTDKGILDKVFKANEANKRYQVEDRIEGVDYGFYLVVNVFAQKKYFELFMEFLTQRGLDPEYFYNNENNYYYVYLKKYDKLSEIESARRTRYNGRYFGETWILWVRNN